jgi:nucleoside-diphosphate-sugar epimerase
MTDIERGRVLVTGASGFVGSYVAEELASAGWRVRCLVRPTSKRGWLTRADFEFALGDVNDLHGIPEALEGCDAVVHAAGITNALHPDEYFQVNAEGTLRLWMAAESHKVKRFVLISSLAAAGPGRGAEPQDESVRPHPVGAYGKSKLTAERAVLGIGGPVEAIVVRPPTVYGPRDRDVLAMIRLAKQGWFPLVGARRLSLVHAIDLAEGVRLALEKGNPGSTYYLTDGEVHSLEAIGVAVGRALGRRARFVSIPNWALWVAAVGGELVESMVRRPAALNLERARQFVQKDWTASDALARRELGYESRYDLIRGMEDTIRWYRSVGWI